MSTESSTADCTIYRFEAEYDQDAKTWMLNCPSEALVETARYWGEVDRVAQAAVENHLQAWERDDHEWDVEIFPVGFRPNAGIIENRVAEDYELAGSAVRTKNLARQNGWEVRQGYAIAFDVNKQGKRLDRLVEVTWLNMRRAGCFISLTWHNGHYDHGIKNAFTKVNFREATALIKEAE